ncbi:MAG: hypothetical protein Kow0065_00570 [Methylomicrobium sp.]
MSEDTLFSEKRKFQIEEGILILLLVLSLTGTGITDYSPTDGYVYWLIMSVIFAISAMIIAWLQSKHKASDIKHILREQTLHWGTSMLIVAAAFSIQQTEQFDETSAGVVVLLILSLSTILDGIRIGWRFSLVGIFLGVSAVVTSIMQRSIWIELLMAIGIVALTILWELWQHKRQSI